MLRYRKATLIGLGIAEGVTILYAVSLVARFVTVHELGWGGYIGLDVPFHTLLIPFVLSVAFAIGFILTFRTRERAG